MSLNEIKTTAADLAKRGYESGELSLENESITNSAAEWYLIIQLANIYYNVFAGIYTKEQAKAAQRDRIEFVRDNQHIFT